MSQQTTNAPTFSVPSTLEKFESRDKDFRCMALADLTAELGKDTFHLDVDSEKKLTKGILKLLTDDHSQVQELAIKCIGPFSKKVTKDAHIQEIVSTLGQHLQNEKKDAHELREIASNAFKNVINSVDENLANVLVNAAVPLLIKGIKDFEKNQDIVYVSLEGLSELLSRFVAKVNDKNQVLQVVQPQLRNKRQLSRKEAANCLGYLSSAIPPDLFVQLINNLLKGIQEAKGDELRSYVHSVSSISRSASERIGKFLPQLVRALLKHTDSNDDNLRDDSLQCLETLILRCPREVTPFLKEIHEIGLKFIKLENVMEEDQEGSDMETEEEEEEEDEGEEEEQEEDDEDITWKVRRASIKVLSAIVTSRPELIGEIYDKTAAAYIARFKREAEANVRAEVYTAFTLLVRQTLALLRKDPKVNLQAVFVEWGNKTATALGKFLKTKSKSIQARAGGFGVLKEIALACPNIFKENFAVWLPALTLALGDKGSGPELKRESLQFLRAYLATTSPKFSQQHLKALNPLIFKSIKDKNAKIAAEGLRVGCALVSTLKAEGFDAKPYLKDFFTATVEKLKTADTEVDVKETSITCTALLISHFSADFKNEIPAILEIFIARIGNEITALAALKAVETLANARLDLGNHTAGLLKTVSGTLSITSLQQVALSTLGALVRTYGSEKAVIDQYQPIVAAVAHFVSDSDLQLAQLALVLYSNILQRHPAVGNGLGDVVNKAIQLLRAAQLPVGVRATIGSFLGELGKVEAKNLTFDNLHKQLLTLVDKDASPNVISNAARGIGAIVSTAKADKQDATVSKYEKEITSKEYHQRQLAFLVLGEVAALLPSQQDKLLNILLQNSGSSDEATRLVVADSLGRTLASVPKDVLPQFLGKIKSGSPLEKAVVISAIRYAVSSATPQLEAELAPAIPALLESLKDSDLNVRREVVLLVNALLRNKQQLIIDSIQNFIPQLFDEARLKAELIHTIELGTTKVTVDNGYDNRLAAFEAINILLDLIPQSLNINDFIGTQLVDGLKNQNAPLVILSHSILLKVTNIPSAAPALAAALNDLVEPLILAIIPPPDPNKKEDQEKKVLEASDEEVIRGSFRVISALSRLPETQGNAKLDEFLQKTSQNADLAAKLKESEVAAAISLRSSGHQSLRSSRQ